MGAASHTFFSLRLGEEGLECYRAFGHYLREDTVLRTRPVFLKVELSRYCTVECRYCSCPKGPFFYPFERFQSLVDTFAPHALMIQLYEIGEPLHHPRILECIQYAHSRRVGTVISTSLSIDKPKSFWTDLVVSGLDKLIVAVDGITEAVYKEYRTKGDLDLVFGNLQSVMDCKKKTRNNLCVEWQMIDFPWNKCEQDLARKLSLDLGCDEFRIIPNILNSREAAKAEKKLRRRNCIWPFLLFLVNECP